MEIRPACFPADLVPVRTLFRIYADSLGIDLGFQNFEDELAKLPGLYIPPVGGVWLAEDREIAGCVALRPWTNEAAEMKRLFVRPEFQGRGIGRSLTERAIAAAKEMGYGSIYLDTLPSMTAAINLYRSLGFAEIARYNTNMVPGAMFFGKEL